MSKVATSASMINRYVTHTLLIVSQSILALNEDQDSSIEAELNLDGTGSTVRRSGNPQLQNGRLTRRKSLLQLSPDNRIESVYFKEVTFSEKALRWILLGGHRAGAGNAAKVPRAGAGLSVNGRAVDVTITDGIAVLTRRWADGGRIELQLPRTLRTSTRYESSVAIERSPVVPSCTHCASRIVAKRWIEATSTVPSQKFMRPAPEVTA